MQPTAPGEGVSRGWPPRDARVSSRSMCEHFIARAAEPFRLDELWPFTERLERFGLAGYRLGRRLARRRRQARRRTATSGHSATIPGARPSGRPRRHRPWSTCAVPRACRRGRCPTRSRSMTRPAASRSATTATCVTTRTCAPTYRAAGRIHGRADTEVGERWLEDEWQPDALRGLAARGASRALRRAGQPRAPGRRRDGAPLRRQRREPRLRVPPRPDRARVDRDLLARPLALQVRGAGGHRAQAGSACTTGRHDSGPTGRHSVVN